MNLTAAKGVPFFIYLFFFFFGFRMVINGGVMDLWGGVEGGLMVRGCFGDEGVE